MSKRMADGQGGAERYGGMDMQQDAALDPPKRATAAQLAKRSIKPLKGRPGASRSSSPSKGSPAPSFNPFGGADSNPFGQSAPQPPASSSFNFGQSSSQQPESNPFASMSASQSFPPANNAANPSFSFGASQPQASPGFAPPSTSSFNFGTSTPAGTSFSFGASPAKPQENGTNKTPSFTFGASAASPAPASPSTSAPAFNPFGSVSFGGDSQEKPLSAAEIAEIESAGPRLSQEGKLDDLANIVRHSDAKYKDANLGGLNLAALPAKVQKQMLDFVRGNNKNVSVGSYGAAHGSPDINLLDSPFLKEPETYTHLPAFSPDFFMTAHGRLDLAKLNEASQDARMPMAWQMGIAMLQSKSDEAETGGYALRSFDYESKLQHHPQHAGNAHAINLTEGGMHHQSTTAPNQLDAHCAWTNSNTLIDPQLLAQQSLANNVFYQTPEPEAAKSSFNFGSTTPSTSFSFGASASTAPSSSQPAAESSPFKGFGTAAPAPPAASTPATSSFNFGTSTQKEAPAAASFKFGAPAEKSDTAPAASPFNFGTSTESTSQPKETPAKAPAPAFNFGAAASASPAPSKPADKPSFSFGAPAATPKAAEEVSYPKLNGADPQPESAPAASPFNFSSTTAAPSASSPFKPAAPAPAAEPPKPQSTGLGSSMFSGAPTQQKPAESAFKGFGASTSASAPPASAPSSGFQFGSVSAQAPAPAPPSASSFGTSAQPGQSNALTRSSAANGVATPPASPDLTPADSSAQQIQQLNQSFRAHLASADLSHDWTAVARYYCAQVEQLRRERDDAASSSAPKQIAAAPSSTHGQKRRADEEADREEADKRSKTSTSSSTTPQKPLSSTASLFNDILSSAEKPKTPQQTNVFSTEAPATAPPAKSNPFASIAKTTSATPGPAPKPAASAFNPPAASAAKPAAPPAFQIPKFGAGVGASAGGGVNFMSAFGKKAAAEEDKEREKRKLEDMDSDEDEEEWEKRDAEEQAKKKAQLQSATSSLKFTLDASKKSDAAASAVFSFGKTSSTPTASANIFGHLSGQSADDEHESDADDDDDVDDALNKASPAKPASGKSLFDRVEYPSDAEKEKPSTSGASFTFSSFGSNTSPAGDNTWKESTPIKFGTSVATAGTTTPEGSPAKPAAPKFNFGAAANATPSGDKPFSGLFGNKSAETPKPAAAPLTSIFASAADKSSSSTGFQFGTPGASSLAPPSGGSVFGSATTSRATTPGATTTDAEGSAAESEPSDTPNDAQTDLTALTPEDLAANDLVLESRCKAMRFEKDSDPKWQNKGVGPIRILSSKETNKPRILMRTAPSGRIALNFNVVLNKTMYTHKGGKMAQLLVPTEDKKMETFACTFKEASLAKEFVDKIHEAIDKAEK